MSLKRGQVYLATHTGEGKPLSNMERSFISFTWGGRKIEDFGFIATIDGDRLSRNLYSEFEDLTTDYDIVDGQIFWGSKYNPLELSFTLSTDGVKEATLQAFRNWFKAGVTRELILSETPNRAIQARVSAAPSFSLLPFEDSEEVKIGNKTYTTRTTLWKGDLSISFIMEDPFWYNIQSSFSSADELDEEIIKIILEDGVPHFDMFSDFSSSEDDVCFLANNMVLKNGEIQTNNSNMGISLVANQPQYIYYCGTGKCYPTIYFDCTTTFENDYIVSPRNSHSAGDDPFYNSIIIEHTELLAPEELEPLPPDFGDDYGMLGSAVVSIDNDDTISSEDITNAAVAVTFKSEFDFTTPGILTSYNQIIKIVKEDYHEGDSIIEMKKAFRDTITDYYMRAKAIGICDSALKGETSGICNTETSALTSGYQSAFITEMKKIFNESSSIPVSYMFNSKTGESTVSLNIFMKDLNNNSNVTVLDQSIPIIENAGDMARSSYLIIDSRTLPTDGKITTDDCLTITSNCNLSNVQLVYNYMYL